MMFVHLLHLKFQHLKVSLWCLSPCVVTSSCFFASFIGVLMSILYVSAPQRRPRRERLLTSEAGPRRAAFIYIQTATHLHSAHGKPIFTIVNPREIPPTPAVTHVLPLALAVSHFYESKSSLQM